MTKPIQGQQTQTSPGKGAQSEVNAPQALQQPIVMECGAAITPGQMERFVQNFEKASRRWEVVVYPAMFAFVVLAGYGFFLIYSLSSNIAMMARSLDPNMGQHMGSMTASIQNLSEQIQHMSLTIDEMSMKLNSLPPMLGVMQTMNSSVLGMSESVGQMNSSVYTMSINIEQMRLAMANMNQNVSRPMSFFNSFAPW